MRFLADDRLEGRGTASRGYDIAAAYVAARFDALGLETMGDSGSYFQNIPFRFADVVESECTMSLVIDGRERRLSYGDDYLMGGDYLREKSEVDAGLVFAGFGVTAPELGHDDYAGIDARGKTVVLLSGAPSQFPNDHRAYYSSGTVKQDNAVAHGAIGILTVRTPVDERRSTWERSVRQNRMPGARWLDPDGTPHQAHPELRVTATLNRPAASSLFTAPHTLDSVFAVADKGRTQGFPLTAQVRASRSCRHRAAESHNVAALLRGSDPSLRDEIVVYSGHLDHLGIGPAVNGDSIYNGAFDNASGIAILLETARILSEHRSRPRRSILFLAVTGEEKGLQGSEYFCHHPTLPIESVVANINLDMVLTLGPLKRVVVFRAEHSSLGEVFAAASRGVGVQVIPDPNPEEVVFIRSDQYSFVKRGIPAAFPVVGQDATPAEMERMLQWRKETYHMPQDDLSQRIDWNAMARFGRVSLLAGWQVANATSRPRWNPGDFFGEKFARTPK